MKRSLFVRLSAGLGLGLLVGGPREARADEKGDKALQAIDDAIFNKAKTQFIEYEAAINVKDKPTRQARLGVYMKAEKRFTEFLAPSDVKGTKVLILSPSQMYVYLPAFGKVRRIASHVTDQGFMGMNFAQDEMSITSYTKMYTAKITSDDGKVLKLTLTAKQGAEAPYAKIDMTVDKEKSLPSELKYYSDTGAHVKTETRSNYSTQDGVSSPVTLKMVDHTKGDANTVLTRKQWKVNGDIPDSRFTKRALEEGT